jgi:hypothetical protein
VIVEIPTGPSADCGPNSPVGLVPNMSIQQNNVTTAIIAVFAHAAITLLHGISHAKLQIELPAWGNLFVVLVILIGPFCGLLLLKLGKHRLGAWVLFMTMLGAFLFGLWNHMLVPGPDHVAHLPDAAWKIPFQITAFLLLATEAIGVVIGLRLLSENTQTR